MGPPRERQMNATVGAAILAVLAGSVSCFIWCYALICIGFWTRVVPLVILGPQPKEFAWIMAGIYGSGIVVMGIATWLVFRHLRKTIILPTR